MPSLTERSVPGGEGRFGAADVASTERNNRHQSADADELSEVAGFVCHCDRRFAFGYGVLVAAGKDVHAPDTEVGLSEENGFAVALGVVRGPVEARDRFVELIAVDEKGRLPYVGDQESTRRNAIGGEQPAGGASVVRGFQVAPLDPGDHGEGLMRDTGQTGSTGSNGLGFLKCPVCDRPHLGNRSTGDQRHVGGQAVQEHRLCGWRAGSAAAASFSTTAAAMSPAMAETTASPRRTTNC